ncbi:MAG: PilZ domain-containing protein [Anaerolineales bacterium]
MSEKRKTTRKKLMAITPVYDLNPIALLGYVVNLNMTGVMVIGEKCVEINTGRVVKIEFPGDLPDLASSHISIPVRVAWCKQDESQKFFAMGFEFKQVTTEHATLFQEIIATYQFPDDMPNYWKSLA